ncbi:MAG: UDP-N-acetylglucosamine--N-acetylmuramyl-(pentapeptide) pyrophosphoryl-undecaprenol N-acetylglucosamine transferase [Corynebacterium sp.]|nr:UDP-N-acetylglucosamine--N-acetylmuramyl-(pentapeptide) pyrophosphoryl-undecaprenol N-acetylglucosamine transferase [Corynebacterium sp.]
MTGGTEREGRFAKPDGRPLSIVVAGGGTAGHIEPALAVADAIREIAPDARITALGTNRGLETTLVPARGYDLRLIPPVPVPRKLTGDLFKLPLRVARAVSEARAVLDDVEADAVIGFGGYVSAPAYLACRRGRRIPFLVHEANARAGMANKLGVKLGGEGLTAVSGSGMAGDVVGIPVRRALSTLDRAALRAEAREFFGLPVDGPVLFVTGGSQGARSINEAATGAADDFAAAGIAVLHAHGKKNEVTLPEGRGAAAEPPYVAVPYVDRMDLAYSAADMILCRSGAMSVAEISAVGLPAVYVPLPHGNGEQALNATDIVEAGGGLLVADASLTPASIRDTVIPLLADADRLAEMARATAASGHRDAADAIARRVLGAAAGAPARA